MSKAFDKFAAFAAEYALDYPEQRAGQAFFNALWEKRPDLYKQMTQTELDPFNLDERLPAAWAYVMDNWEQAE